MGNPFDWSARKRRSSNQNAPDPYDQYFQDRDDEFPHFGSTWDAFNRIGNKQSQHPSEANDRSGFFDYLPQEFRQYIPDDFGFGGMRQMHPHYQAQQPATPQNQQQQQPSQQPQSQPQQPQQTNLCDAAIQTEDVDNQQNGGTNKCNNQESQGHTNKSASDGGINRSSSNSSASSSSKSTPYGNNIYTSTSANGPGAFASASAGNNAQQNYQQTPQNFGRQFHHQQQPFPHQYGYQTQPPQQTHFDESNARTVPIFFEGNVPVSRTTANASAQAPSQNANQQQQHVPSNKARPEPFNKEAFQPQPEQQQQPPQGEQQHSGKYQLSLKTTILINFNSL